MRVVQRQKNENKKGLLIEFNWNSLTTSFFCSRSMHNAHTLSYHGRRRVLKEPF